ncbi:MAG: hypothetical protein AAGE01_22430, partial [Pseudomonadota bacterium]
MPARAAAIVLVLLLFPSIAVSASTDKGWETLVSIDQALAGLQAWPRTRGQTLEQSLQETSIAEREATIAALRARLDALAVQDWSVAGKADYLVVWAQLNGVDFQHRVTRPWQRDPIFYLRLLQRIPYAELPFEGTALERFGRELRAVPAIAERARANLTDPLGELAGLAVFHLDHFDGVGQGQPYRDAPPGGTIAWFDDLCRRVETHHPDELATCRAARDALADWRDWLRDEQPLMTASAGIGAEELEWYFRNVRLLPWSAAEMGLLGQREYHRYHAAYRIARNRNKALPELALTTSREQHEKRTREAEAEIRALLIEQGLLTFP